jgi:hypothetical protein
MLNEEPAQSQDLQMMGMLLPLGIEKGKDFKPDVAPVARLNSAAAEAHAWLLAQIPTFVTDWWPGRRQAAGEFADRRVLPFHAVPTFGLSSYDNDKVQEYDYGLTPGVKSNPSHAREHCTDEKRYPHADLEEHNHIGVAWSRRSKKAFVDCIASVRAVPVPGAAAVRP